MMLDGHIEIRLVSVEAVPAVSGDPIQLEQVLLNVVLNACEAIGASTTGPRVITIETRQNGPDHVIIDVAEEQNNLLGQLIEECERVADCTLGLRVRGKIGGALIALISPHLMHMFTGTIGDMLNAKFRNHQHARGTVESSFFCA